MTQFFGLEPRWEKWPAAIGKFCLGRQSLRAVVRFIFLKTFDLIVAEAMA